MASKATKPWRLNCEKSHHRASEQDVNKWQIIGGAVSAALAIARPITQPNPLEASSYIWAGAPGAAANVSYGATARIDSSQVGQVCF